MTTATSGNRLVRTQSLVKAGAIAGLVAAVANVVVFLVAKLVVDPLAVKTGSSTMDVIFVQPLVASFVAVFLGALVLQLMLRLSSGVRIWTVVAVVFVVVYTAYAFSAAANTSTGVALTIMHVVALAVAFALLLPVARSRVAA